MSQKKEKEPTFEQGVARLEELIEELEGGDLDLDKSLAVFEEGVKLSRRLNRKLDEAEKRLELLLKDEDGGPLAEKFSLEPGEADEL